MISVVGANGMLGQDIIAAAQRAGIPVTGIDLPQIDITDKKSIEQNLPVGDTVINCAAYTRVDDAEADADTAHKVNGLGAYNLAQVCAERRTRMIQISTDYVFDGTAGTAYTEEDPVNPLSVYGQSKRDGEVRTLEANANSLVIRTQSLFGVNGPNFVKAISNRLRSSDEPLRVVEDQVSAPTYTGHLAEGILRLVRIPQTGIVHLTASGYCSWHAFACAIANVVKPGATVNAIPASELDRPAPRPGYSVLDNGKYESWTGSRLPAWEDGLADYLREEAI